MPPADLDLAAEAERLMVVCNACRYCEGHCAVFPAMELRLAFPHRDLRYLANLCHGCGSCFHHCQYAPPHEFDVNVPKVFAELRRQTYRRYAWPGFLARLFDRNALVAAVATAASLVLLLLLAVAMAGGAALVQPHGSGRFYDVIPHAVMAGFFGAVGLCLVAAIAAGFVRFWRDAGEGALTSVRWPEVSRAIRDALSLHYLDGGGDGCTYPGEAPSLARRWFHHFTFYGFLLCFAATCAATVYHYSGVEAPYAWWTPPVVLGTAGGIGLLVGPVGLLVLKRRSDPEPNDRGQFGVDVSFALLLLLTSATGLALLFLRATSAMGILLVVHLGFVLALFVMLPYGKFIHAPYRLGALVRYSIERARPPPLQPDE